MLFAASLRTFWLALAILLCLAVPTAAVQCSLPDTPEINSGDHTQHFLHELVNCQTILLPGMEAAVGEFITQPAGFGSGAHAYFYDYGVSMLDTVNSDIVRSYLFPVTFRQREEYEPSASILEPRLWKRVQRVAMHSFFLSDSHTINMSGIPASFALAGLSDAYYPSPQQRLPGTLRRAGINAAGFFVTDFVTEFRPELCKIVSFTHLHC